MCATSSPYPDALCLARGGRNRGALRSGAWFCSDGPLPARDCAPGRNLREPATSVDETQARNLEDRRLNGYDSCKCLSALADCGHERRQALRRWPWDCRGKLMISERPRTSRPLRGRESKSGAMAKLAVAHDLAKAGQLALAITARVASGVTSRSAKPVPPVVMMRWTAGCRRIR